MADKKKAAGSTAEPAVGITMATSLGKIDYDKRTYEVNVDVYLVHKGAALKDAVVQIKKDSTVVNSTTNDKGHASLTYKTPITSVAHKDTVHLVVIGHLIARTIDIDIPSLDTAEKKRVNPRYLKPEPCVRKDGSVSVHVRALDPEDQAVVKLDVVAIWNGYKKAVETDKNGFASFSGAAGSVKKGETVVVKFYITGIEEEAVVYLEHPEPRDLTKEEVKAHLDKSVARFWLVVLTAIACAIFVVTAFVGGVPDMPWSHVTLSPEEIAYNLHVKDLYPDQVIVADKSNGAWQWIVYPLGFIVCLLLMVVTTFFSIYVSQSDTMKKWLVKAFKKIRKWKGGVARDGLIDRMDEFLEHRKDSAAVSRVTTTAAPAAAGTTAAPAAESHSVFSGGAWNLILVILTEIGAELFAKKLIHK